jgi:hypothetical protein
VVMGFLHDCSWCKHLEIVCGHPPKYKAAAQTEHVELLSVQL